MERIPREFQSKVRSKNKDGSVKISIKVIDLTEHNLPIPASFESDYMNFQVNLVPFASEKDPETKMVTRKENTGVTIRFKSGYYTVYNKYLLKLMFESKGYERRKIRPNRQDPTGFWRSIGMIETTSVPVVSEVKVAQPGYDDIDFKALAEAAKSEEAVQPVEQVRR